MARDEEGEGRALRRVAFGVAAACVVFIGLFIGGETITDPGGWEAVGLIAVWLVPLLGLGWFGLRRPDIAQAPLVAITGAVVVLSIVAAVFNERWSAFQNRRGPVDAIVMFALFGVLAAFGYRRPRVGGALLVVGALVPALLGMVTGGPGTAALPFVAAPAVLVGTLYLFSSHTPSGSSGASGGESSGRATGPGQGGGTPERKRRQHSVSLAAGAPRCAARLREPLRTASSALAPTCTT